MNFSGKEGHPNIQPSTRPEIELGTSGLGGRDLNHCANPSEISQPFNNCYYSIDVLLLFYFPSDRSRLQTPFGDDDLLVNDRFVITHYIVIIIVVVVIIIISSSSSSNYLLNLHVLK